VKERLLNSRGLFPLIEVARESRSPLRQRYAAARRGQDTAVLDQLGRRRLFRYPWRAVARLFGVANPRGPVWGVTMVRNEAPRIERSVLQLLDGGVDIVVVADNLSTDETPFVLDDLARKHPVVVLSDSEPAYYQGPKMSRLARAAARCGASWIVPFDADELWYGIDAPLADRLHSSRANTVIVSMFDFLPPPSINTATDPYTDFTVRTRTPGTAKVAFRAHLLATIATGNHSVSQPGPSEADLAVIRHYPYLSLEHFIEKARHGSAALSQTDLPRNVGEHWRAWGEASSPELLEAWRALVATGTVDDPLPSLPFIRSSDAP